MSARIISTLGRAIDVIVAGRVVSHLRFAAGVCVLAAVLLMGSAGGAVAVADRDSSGSARQQHGRHQQRQARAATTARQPGSKYDTRRNGRPGRTSTHGIGPTTGPAASTGTKSPKKEAARTPRTTRKTRASPLRFPIKSRRSPLRSRRFPIKSAPVATAVAPVPDLVAPVANAVAPVPDLVAPVAT